MFPDTVVGPRRALLGITLATCPVCCRGLQPSGLLSPGQSALLLGCPSCSIDYCDCIEKALAPANSIAGLPSASRAFILRLTIRQSDRRITQSGVERVNHAKKFPLGWFGGLSCQ